MNEENQKTLYAVLVIIGFFVIIFLLVRYGRNYEKPLSYAKNFEECVAEGNPVMESYPRQCKSKDGTLFVEELPDDASPLLPNENPSKPAESKKCAIGGCSSQLCISEEESKNGGGVSTCEFRPEYACYKKNSRCEAQSNGECGWTNTPELKSCLTNPPAM